VALQRDGVNRRTVEHFPIARNRREVCHIGRRCGDNCIRRRRQPITAPVIENRKPIAHSPVISALRNVGRTFNAGKFSVCSAV
jgi:hypothetical protein